jgi:yopX protein
MRKIEFRVWDKDGEEYFPICEDLGFGLIGITAKGNNILFMEDGEVSTGDAEDYIIEQFTGLKDKNNKMIYENDIIHVIDHGDYAVTWNFLQCGFELSPIYTGQDKVRLVASGKSRYEVVSNIHDYRFEEDRITYLINRQIIKGNTIF